MEMLVNKLIRFKEEYSNKTNEEIYRELLKIGKDI